MREILFSRKNIRVKKKKIKYLTDINFKRRLKKKKKIAPREEEGVDLN